MPFRCSRTGMYFPDDYVENWGKKYGIGLGPVPVSEALVNEYNAPIAIAGDSARTMHPVACCQAPIHYVEKIPQGDIDKGKDKPILAIDDPDMQARGLLMRDKQLLKSATLKTIAGVN